MRRYPYLLSIPAILALTIYAGILIRSVWIQDSLLGRYRGLAQSAIANAEYELAQTYYERVIQLGRTRDPDDDLNLALAKFRTGDIAGGQSLLDRLAPDDGIGYSKAHRLKAIQVVAALTKGKRGGGGLDPSNGTEPSMVNQSQWELVRLHLTRSGLDQPVELADLWTAYYLAAGQPGEAIARQMDASQLEPSRWLATAQLCANLRDERQWKIASERAEAHLAAKITKNPFDHLTRIDLARVYVDNQRLAEADALVLEGLRLAGADASPQVLALRRAASELMLMKIDAVEDGSDGDLAKKLLLVAKAIELDADNLRAYEKNAGALPVG